MHLHVQVEHSAPAGASVAQGWSHCWRLLVARTAARARPTDVDHRRAAADENPVLDPFHGRLLHRRLSAGHRHGEQHPEGDQ